jgi:hypothetical protein
MKIISFSVWGSNPRYLEGAIKNVELAKQIFFDWKCRFYYNSSVPKQWVDLMLKYDNVELFYVDSCEYGMFWRFYPMFEDDTFIVISRDADSRLSEKELRCVNEWISSDKQFSVIRDHVRHYDYPMLGGMWGMKGKLNSDLFQKMKTYSFKHAYTIDQIYLRECVWPSAEKSVFIHGVLEHEWMKNGDPRKFIGQGYDEHENYIY